MVTSMTSTTPVTIQDLLVRFALDPNPGQIKSTTSMSPSGGSQPRPSTSFEDYLKSIVGVKPAIAARVVAALANDVDDRSEKTKGKQVGDTGASSAKAHLPRVTVAVEGNIGCGKSTFLGLLGGNAQGILGCGAGAGGDGLEGVELIPEPVAEWQRVRRPIEQDLPPPSPSPATSSAAASSPAAPTESSTALTSADGGDKDRYLNVLDAFYRDPKRMGYTFQNFVFLTRVCQERSSWCRTPAGGAAARVLERSIFSDRMVFVRAGRVAGNLDRDELALYDHWYRPMLNAMPTLVPDGFVYLRARPETCLRRLKIRNRSEEVGIGMEYLQTLHGYHEDWLFAGMPFDEALALSVKARSARLRGDKDKASIHRSSSSHQFATPGDTSITSTNAANSNDKKRNDEDEKCNRRPQSGNDAGIDACGTDDRIEPYGSPPSPMGSRQEAATDSALARASSSEVDEPRQFWGESPAFPPPVPLDQDPPLDLDLIEVPESIRPMVRFIDATKSRNVVLRQLHKVPTLVLESDRAVDVYGDALHGDRLRQLVREFIEFVRQYRRLCHRQGLNPAQRLRPKMAEAHGGRGDDGSSRRGAAGGAVGGGGVERGDGEYFMTDSETGDVRYWNPAEHEWDLKCRSDDGGWGRREEEEGCRDGDDDDTDRKGDEEEGLWNIPNTRRRVLQMALMPSMIADSSNRS